MKHLPKPDKRTKITVHDADKLAVGFLVRRRSGWCEIGNQVAQAQAFLKQIFAGTPDVAGFDGLKVFQ